MAKFTAGQTYMLCDTVRPPTSEQKKMYKIDSYGKKKCTGVFNRSKLTNDVRVSHQNTPDFGFGEFFPKKNNFIYSPSVVVPTNYWQNGVLGVQV